jgi:hypothetical protein
MKKKLAILMMSGLFLTNVFTINAQTAKYFVTESGAGLEDGSSWDNASSDLQAIISSASPGERIFVAGGTYKPTRPADDLTNPGESRDNAFVLENGVEIYGGFAGDEADLTERVLTSANATVLSGDLNVGDDPDADAYHVVIAAGLTAATVLDGFTVSDGNASGSGDITLSTVTIARSDGGGIYIKSSGANLTLSNVTVKNNKVSGLGGGIYINAASPKIIGVSVSDNAADTGGGIDISDSSAAPELTNVLIAKNVAVSFVGGINIQNGSGTAKLTNVTIVENSAGTFGGLFAGAGAAPTVKNTIIWGNTLTNADGTTPTYTYSLVQGENLSGTNLDGSDVGLVVFAAGNYTPAIGSPVINAGDNSGFTAADVDLAGNPRLAAGTIDLGAFEHGIKADEDGIVYVKTGGTGNGSSWANAYPNLAFPLLAATDNSDITEIRVAGGTYYPLYKAGTGATDRDKAFVLVEGVNIYGGYDAASGRRDIVANETVLSGDIDAGNNDAYHVVIGAGLTTTATVLDGVTVTGGYADGSGSITVNSVAGITSANGGGIYIRNSNALTLIDVTVKDNEAPGTGGNDGYGGGIYINNSSSKILGGTLSGNTAAYGGGILTEGASPALINVLIADNETTKNGGGINTYNGGSPTLTNVTIAGNTAATTGGGIYNTSSTTTLTVQNTIIWGNTAGASANVGYAAGADPTYYNSVVEGVDLSGANGNLNGNDPDLGLDSDYSLAAGDAVDGGDNALYNSAVSSIADYGDKDQAGAPRIVGGTIDLGALELQSLSLTLTGTSPIVYGGSMKVALTGTSPWKITYTTNGGKEKVVNISGNPGEYDFTPDSVGTCAIISVQNSEYTRDLYNVQFTVDKFIVDVIPDPGQSRRYDDPDPVLTYKYTPQLPFGDYFEGALKHSDGTDIGAYSIQQGTLKIGNNKGGNYDIYFISANFFIVKAWAGTLDLPETISGPIQLPSKTSKDVPVVYTFTPSDAATLVDYLLIPLGGEIHLTAIVTDPNYTPYYEALLEKDIYVIRASSPDQPPIRREVYLPEVPGVVTSLPAGLHHVISGTDFVFVLSPAEGREFEEAPVVRASRPNDPDVIVLDATVTLNGDGTYTVTIPGVIQPIDVVIEAPVTPGTGTAAITGNSVWSAGRRLYIQAVAPGEAQVYAQSGALVKAIPYAAGETVTELPAGIYIIKANGKAQKVVVNK